MASSRTTSTAVQWTCGDPPSYSSASFGSMLRSVRAHAGLSQRQLAEMVGTTQSAIARLEAGGAEPKLCTLEKLATGLNSDMLLRVAPTGDRP